MALAASLRFKLEEEEQPASPAFCFNLSLNNSKTLFCYKYQ